MFTAAELMYYMFLYMAIIYFNGIPVNDSGYAYGIEQYLSPRERVLTHRDIQDVEYEDLTENDNEK